MHGLHPLLAIVAISLAGCSSDRAPPASPHEQLSVANPTATPEAVTKRPVTDADRDMIYDAVLRHALMDPVLEDSREFYGNPKSNQFVLVGGIYGISWPESYTPAAEGYKQTRIADIDPHGPRLLGVRLDKFDLEYKSKSEFRMFGGQIEITLFIAGGNTGGHIGGCSVYYDAHRDGEKWAVEYIGANDP